MYLLLLLATLWWSPSWAAGPVCPVLQTWLVSFSSCRFAGPKRRIHRPCMSTSIMLSLKSCKRNEKWIAQTRGGGVLYIGQLFCCLGTIEPQEEVKKCSLQGDNSWISKEFVVGEGKLSLPLSVPATLAAQQGRELPHRHYPCLKANAKHKKG